MRIKSVMLGVVIVAFAVSGCSNSSDVTLHKPGVYKGAIDPLIEKQQSPQQQERLVARFNLVQTDR
jgi:hypothetical protein